jgi:hypothetical protein
VAAAAGAFVSATGRFAHVAVVPASSAPLNLPLFMATPRDPHREAVGGGAAMAAV